MFHRGRLWVAYALLLLMALGFRLFVALRLPNDTPDDGRVYAQIARNVLEQHVYSHESQPPYVPSLIRLPGYPLFLTAVYAIFGHGNNRAVRVIQAVIDAATCLLIALVAFHWAPNKQHKHAAAFVAFALAAVCPFTAIYTATILTEVPTDFLAVALVLPATRAFEATKRKQALTRWAITGLIAGLAVLFRPDSGLFAAAIGMTILMAAVQRISKSTNRRRRIAVLAIWRSVQAAAVFSMAFCLVLIPWTIRNRQVFHLFQPLSPTHGEMPGEFVPRGYLLWLRTWLDDGRYVGPVLWQLDTAPIEIDDFPDRAFDSRDERDRVTALLKKYNHPPEEQESEVEPESPPQTNAETAPKIVGKPPASPAPEPSTSDEEEEQDEETSDDDQQTIPEEFSGEMTRDIDADFAEIGRERISRAPVRYYLVLPIKRAVSLWFDTHSQYYPFEGELLPLEDLNHEIHQQLWLPLFAGLTWIYSMLGVLGAWLLWRSQDSASRRWVLLAGLVIFLRLGFFATLENPEPRYTVEVFPFLAILGGVAISQIPGLRRPRERHVNV